MTVLGAAGDFAETKDSNANVDSYTSAIGEEVTQFGFALGNPFLFGAAATATVPATVSLAQTNAAAAASGVVLTLPGANAVNVGHILIIQDANGGVTSSNTVAVKTPAGGGKVGAVANNTASTSAASYAFINSAYGSIRLASDGTNWNPF